MQENYKNTAISRLSSKIRFFLIDQFSAFDVLKNLKNPKKIPIQMVVY